MIVSEMSPLHPEARALIRDSQRALEAIFPPDLIFTLGAEELARPGTRFFVAWTGGAAVGCVALTSQGACGEIKRLFTRDGARGRGVGRALMAAAERAARRDGKTFLRLETGPQLRAAVGLYTALGYHPRGPFGAYAAHPQSLFMEKPLD